MLTNVYQLCVEVLVTRKQYTIQVELELLLVFKLGIDLTLILEITWCITICLTFITIWGYLVLLTGLLHRKQKNSYETSGRNPTDLDLLDQGSEREIQSLTLEERTKPFVDAGVGLSIPATRLI